MMCDIISAPTANFFYFRLPAIANLLYPGAFFDPFLTYLHVNGHGRSLHFSRNDLFWLLKQCTAVPVVFPPHLSFCLSQPSELGVPQALYSGPCSAQAIYQVIPSKSLVSSHCLHWWLINLLSEYQTPILVWRQLVISSWMSLTHDESIHPKFIHYLSFPRLVPSALPVWVTGIIIYPHTYDRSLEVIHSTSLLHSQWDFLHSSLPPHSHCLCLSLGPQDYYNSSLTELGLVFHSSTSTLHAPNRVRAPEDIFEHLTPVLKTLQ